jgi:phosphatidylserine decarboxylase
LLLAASKKPDLPLAGVTAVRPPLFQRLILQEDLNFLLTNRIPRRYATLFMGWFSKLEIGWLKDASLRAWRAFSPDLDLSEAKPTEYRSLHDVFVRELRPGARPIDPDPCVVTSPCDAVIGAHGRLEGVSAIQAKGFPYSLRDLLGDDELVERHRDGKFVTLRLRSSMYHRFHAPCDGRLDRVTYVSGDTWNVNPITLRRVERLFCKNERAILDLRLRGRTGAAITMVPVAAILVASIRMHCLPETLDLCYRGPNVLPCDASFAKGDELGWFQHGSTILMFATGDFRFAEGVAEGATIRVGQPLFRTNSPLSAAPCIDSREEPDQ